MKLRNFIISLLAVTVLAAGCNKNEIEPSYDGFSTSVNFINIPEDGSEVSFEVNSTESWAIYDRLFPEDKNWKDFDVEPLSGKPGKTTIKISSSATASNRQMELCFIIGDKSVIDALCDELDAVVAEYDNQKNLALDKADEDAVKKVWDKKKKAAEQVLNTALVNAKRQYVTVKQSAGKTEVKYSTCKEIAEGTVGKTYYAKGSVTKIVNTQYGNWTLKDASGEMYVYGTLDATGAEKNFESLGLSEGDMVELSGPSSSYKGSPQLTNVTILKIEKAFIKLEKNEMTVKKDAKTFDVPLTIADDAKWDVVPFEEDWLSLGSSYTKDGKTYQTFNIVDYLEDKAPRKATLKFTAQKEAEVKTKSVKDPEEGQLPSVTTDKGVLAFEGKQLAIGTELFVLSGEARTPAEDGDYVLEDKTTIEVKDGKIVSIIELKVAELAFIVNQTGNFPDIVTVKAASETDDETWVRIKGVVMGVNEDGSVVADETGAIYCDGVTDFEIGETVEVCGNKSAYRKFFQLEGTYAKGIPADSEAVYPTPTKVTENLFTTIDEGGDNLLKYVTLTGKPSNVEDTDNKGKFVKNATVHFKVGESYDFVGYRPSSDFYTARTKGKEVEIDGYCYQRETGDGNNYIRFIITDVRYAPEEETGAETE